MRKKGWILLISLVVIIVIAVIGGKMYMDNQENKKMEQERKIAIQAKDMFKDIKEIKVGRQFESSPGTINFDLLIFQKNDVEFKTYITLGDKDFISGADAISQKGRTSDSVHVLFSNGTKEVIK